MKPSAQCLISREFNNYNSAAGNRESKRKEMHFYATGTKGNDGCIVLCQGYQDKTNEMPSFYFYPSSDID
jgi:hypothetical protein